LRFISDSNSDPDSSSDPYIQIQIQIRIHLQIQCLGFVVVFFVQRCKFGIVYDQISYQYSDLPMIIFAHV
jgi:hypothetical protein